MTGTEKYTIIQALSDSDGRATLNVGGKITNIQITSVSTDYDGVSIEADFLTPASRSMNYAFDLNKIDISREEKWLKKFTDERRLPSINKVVFNDPATIVMWSDGTKTVVKAQDEDFDPEKGLAMAISKKALGNKGNYCNEIKKWTEKYDAPFDPNAQISFTIPKALKLVYAYDALRAVQNKQKTTKGGLFMAIDEAINYLSAALYDKEET